MSEMVYIDKKDKVRTLLTETIPFETPIIFSNFGFYKKYKEYLINGTVINSNYKKLFETYIVGNNEKKSWKIPFKYDIYKIEGETRSISLVHPLSQIELLKIYEKYADLICYYCSLSPASLRFPKRTSSKFSIPSSMGVYIDKSKYLPNFFSYGGVSRLYKFYNSNLFLKLESTYKFLKIIDISKCFNNIYTHSISWAISNKEFIKSGPVKGSFFGDDFDTAIRGGNYGETHGIPIGQEVSRIFSEIILQRVDLNVIRSLKKKGMIYNEDYSFKRYVDDIYIFSNKKDYQNEIYQAFSMELSNYNLYINKSKIKDKERPFVSSKDKAIFEIKYFINLFINNLFSDKDNKLKKIFNMNNKSNFFVGKVKIIMDSYGISYDDINPFIIGVLSKRIMSLINSFKDSKSIEEYNNRNNVIYLLIDLVFYFYRTSPNTNNSYSLIVSIGMVTGLLNSEGEGDYDLKFKIFHEIKRILILNKNNAYNSINSLNLLLSIYLLNDNGLLLGPDFVEEVFIKNKGELDYFSFVSLLYYLGGNCHLNNDFLKLKDKVVDKLKNRLVDISNNKEERMSIVKKSSELTHLFLDAIFCPFIDDDDKKILYHSLMDGHLNNTSEFLTYIGKKQGFFVNWGPIDIQQLFLKKELRKSY